MAEEVPKPFVKFLKTLRALGIDWDLEPILSLRPKREGMFLKRGITCIRVTYDRDEKRFYIAQTNDENPGHPCLFDHPDPVVIANRARSFFP